MSEQADYSKLHEISDFLAARHFDGSLLFALVERKKQHMELGARASAPAE